MCPEGPELAVSRDVLRESLIMKRIQTSSKSLSGQYRNKDPRGMDLFRAGAPWTVVDIRTHGKLMWWSLLDSRTASMLQMACTYGMTAQWMPADVKHAHNAFTLYFLDAADDYAGAWSFVDQRHFGTIKFLTPEELNRKLASMGPCVLTSQIDPGIFAERILKKPWVTICETLLDQSALAGVGNYMRAEILYRARVDPWQLTGDLSVDDLLRLHEETLAVARESYAAGGTTIETFESPDGRRGTYSDRLLVYGRKTDPEGNVVQRLRDSTGRTVHWVPGRDVTT